MSVKDGAALANPSSCLRLRKVFSETCVKISCYGSPAKVSCYMKCFQKVFRNVESWATNTWSYNPDTHSSGWLLFFLLVQSKIRQVHTILPLLTDNVQENVEVRKQLSFRRMGHAYSRRQNTQSSLETIEMSGKGIPQNRRISWRQEKGLTSLAVIERILLIHSRWAGF